MLENPFVQIVLGAVGIGFGLLTVYVRSTGRGVAFEKLEAMKKNYGVRGGTALHILAYTALPIVFGMIFLLRAWQQLG